MGIDLAPPSFGMGRERSGSYVSGGDRSGSGSLAPGTGMGRDRSSTVGAERKGMPSAWTSEEGGGGTISKLRGQALEPARESMEGRPSVSGETESEVESGARVGAGGGEVVANEEKKEARFE